MTERFDYLALDLIRDFDSVGKGRTYLELFDFVDRVKKQGGRGSTEDYESISLNARFLAAMVGVDVAFNRVYSIDRVNLMVLSKLIDAESVCPEPYRSSISDSVENFIDDFLPEVPSDILTAVRAGEVTSPDRRKGFFGRLFSASKGRGRVA